MGFMVGACRTHLPSIHIQDIYKCYCSALPTASVTGS